MEGRAAAPAAISYVNAIPAGRGAAAAIDRTVTATVTLDASDGAVTAATDVPGLDTALVRRCVAATTARYGNGEGGHVETAAAVPPAVGLKSSSAAANATVAATLDALGCWDDTDPLEAALVGVEVARAVGVTVTGALDDAAASMLGGLVVTDNREDELLERREPAGHAVVLVPEGRQPTATVDVEALRAVAPLGDLAAEAVLEGREALAMAVNGVAVAAALDLDTGPIEAAFSHTAAVSPSGTGPAVAAVGDRTVCAAVAEAWRPFGTVTETRLRTRGTVTG